MTDASWGKLFGTFATLMVLASGGAALAALSGGLLVPIAAVLLIAVAKTRLVILDFMGLRSQGRGMRLALLSWPVLFLLAAFARSAALALFVVA